MQKFNVVEAMKLGIRCRPVGTSLWVTKDESYLYSSFEILKEWEINKIDRIKQLVGLQIKDKLEIKKYNKELRGRSKWASGDYTPRPAYEVCNDIAKFDSWIRERAKMIRELQLSIESYRKENKLKKAAK